MDYGQPLQYLPLQEARSLELQRTIGDVRKEKERKLRQSWTICEDQEELELIINHYGDRTCLTHRYESNRQGGVMRE